MTSTTTVAAGDRAIARGPRLGSTIVRLTVVELRLLYREAGLLVGLLAFPAVTVLIIAGVFGSTPDDDFGGGIPSDHYVVGYVGVTLAALGLTTLPSLIASRRELGVLRRYRAAGIDSRAILGSYLLLGVVVGVVSGGLVLAVGGAVYGVPVPDDPLRTGAWFAAGLLCFIAIGGALGVVLPTGRAASAIGNLLFVPMFLLGGGGPPRQVMSGAMRTISDLMPLSHLVGGLRLAWLGSTDDPHALWWPAALAAVSVVVAVRSLRRQLL